jgi:hypothetical protein
LPRQSPNLIECSIKSRFAYNPHQHQTKEGLLLPQHGEQRNCLGQTSFGPSDGRVCDGKVVDGDEDDDDVMRLSSVSKHRSLDCAFETTQLLFLDPWEKRARRKKFGNIEK